MNTVFKIDSSNNLMPGNDLKGTGFIYITVDGLVLDERSEYESDLFNVDTLYDFMPSNTGIEEEYFEIDDDDNINPKDDLT